MPQPTQQPPTIRRLSPRCRRTPRRALISTASLRPRAQPRSKPWHIAHLARRCGTDLERFLAEIAVGAETDALDPRAEAVTLLTLHGAKGLEFDVVFLAGCERGLLPLRLPGPFKSGPLTPEDAAEERRLLFVGMTRARERLLLSYAARRARHGSEDTTGRSSFLAVLDPVPPGLTAPRRPRRPADRQLRLL